MSDSRPDPDLLLAQVTAEAAQARRGRLKIFFGASAGVGKTYAMLTAARTERGNGRAVLVGLVETHGRSDTEAMAADLPRLALRTVDYRGRELREFDLDSALEFEREHPDGVLLLDELAHSNVPGSRHPKRWQDVEELLAAGVDVWTTLNVQHLESLNDIVSGITGVRVAETVPDRVFDQADEVVVVDLPPDELLLRLKQGKVYLPKQAERAVANFFRKGNLLALRELALRRTADRVDAQMQAYRRNSAVQTVWPTREALLACVGSGADSEQVVRRCARLAAQLDTHWHAVHVQTAAAAGLSDARRQQVLRVLQIAQDLGATTATLAAPEAAEGLTRYAREFNLSRLVIGRRRRRWLLPWQRPFAERLAAVGAELDVLQIALPRSSAAAAPAGSAPAGSAAGPGGPGSVGGAGGAARAPGASGSAAVAGVAPLLPGYAAAVGLCALTTLLTTLLIGVLELSSIALLFLLTVVLTAVRFGRGPAVLAAVLSVLMFNWFFVPPRFSLAVADERFVLTFAVMLVSGLLVGQLAAGLKQQALAASERERRVRSLYEMSRALGSALVEDEVARIGARFLSTEFGAASALFVTDLDEGLQLMPGASAKADPAVARWALDHARPAGFSTDTLPAGDCLMLPLKAPMRLRGVLAVQPAGRRPWSPEERQLLETCAALLAISLERIHYIQVARTSTVQIESERLRNSLLSAISHDLRTPLASLVGLADTLRLTTPALSPQQDEVAGAIREAALRMNALVNNLLDMARLQAGAVRLNRQWQPLEEVVGSALAASRELLARRHVDVRLADDLPLVEVDAVLIERLLVNLLENAVKYTPPGTSIEIEGWADEREVALAVRDHGAGLPPGREEVVFEKFERGRPDATEPGAGLGLAICRAIARAHGGAIRAEPASGGGTRFVLTVPRGTPPADLGAEAGAQSAASA
jgi:two-component system, OmpR family, sensor histidine kinase KdpD